MYLDLISYFLGILSCFIIQKLWSIFFSHEAGTYKRLDPDQPNDIAEPVEHGEITHGPGRTNDRRRPTTNVSSTGLGKNPNVSSNDNTSVPPQRPTSVPTSALAKRPHPLHQRLIQPQIGLKKPGVEEKWEIIKKFKKPKEVPSYTFPFSPTKKNPENTKKENPENTKKENPENPKKENYEKTKHEEHGEVGFQEMQPIPKIENTKYEEHGEKEECQEIQHFPKLENTQDEEHGEKEEFQEIQHFPKLENTKYEEHGEKEECQEIQHFPKLEDSDILTDSTSLSEAEDDDKLTDEEEGKVKLMIEHLQNLQCPGVPPTRSEALKYLISKNFLLDPSISVSTAYAKIWNKYGFIKMSDIASVLITGLIISPPNCHSKKNEQILYIISRNIDFSKDHPEDRVRSLLFYLQRDLKSKVVQKNGFMLICDLEGAGINPNIPSQKAMISLVQESIPAKARRILIVNGGLVLRIAFETTKMLVSHKIQKRIQILKHTSDLLDYIDKENLLSSLGGTLQYNHQAYIEEELEKERLSSTK